MLSLFYRHRNDSQPLGWREFFPFSSLLLTTLLAAACVHHPSARTPVVPSTTKAVAKRTASATPARTIEPLPASAEQRLGVVRVIGAHGSFVLIETPSAAATAAVPAGHLLHCHAPGVTSGSSTADLRVSPERRQPFLIADVVSGSPTVGDIAYLAADASNVPVHPVVPFSSVIPADVPAPNPAATP